MDLGPLSIVVCDVSNERFTFIARGQWRWRMLLLKDLKPNNVVVSDDAKKRVPHREGFKVKTVKDARISGPWLHESEGHIVG